MLVKMEKNETRIYKIQFCKIILFRYIFYYKEKNKLVFKPWVDFVRKLGEEGKTTSFSKTNNHLIREKFK